MFYKRKKNVFFLFKDFIEHKQNFIFKEFTYFINHRIRVVTKLLFKLKKNNTIELFIYLAYYSCCFYKNKL